MPALSLAAGDLVGVRGPSGAGKSTLLYALSGLAEGAEGQVIWAGTDILGLGSEERAAFRAENVGMVFQDYMLFEELSPQQNAALAGMFARRDRRPAIAERAGGRLQALGLSPEARSVATFSGGERQRVSIARALAAEPRILLADEPTASLDRAAADALIRDLVALTRETGTTFIAVSHDEALLRTLDRVLRIEDGVLASDERLAA